MNSERFHEKLIKLETHKNEDNSSLTVFSVVKTLPFKVERVFYVDSKVKEEIRGNHTHKKCWQFLISLNGIIEVVCDDGKESRSYSLENNNLGLLIPPLIWSNQIYKDENNILLVLASHDYDPKDYIHDYEEFKKYIKLI
jgi:dTDP-4-dehydrorhamnose 3,5-epimerase-like enzyme